MHQAFLRLSRLPERRRLIPHFVPLRADKPSAAEVYLRQGPWPPLRADNPSAAEVLTGRLTVPPETPFPGD